MKVVYAITPDPKRPDLAHEAYERQDEAEAHARELQRQTGRMYFTAPLGLYKSPTGR